MKKSWCRLVRIAAHFLPSPAGIEQRYLKDTFEKKELSFFLCVIRMPFSVWKVTLKTTATHAASCYLIYYD